MMETERKLYDLIYQAVRQIPSGKIASYGQISKIVGRCSAQMVGFALASLRDKPGEPEVPWQRVVNSQGRVALPGSYGSSMQRKLLDHNGLAARHSFDRVHIGREVLFVQRVMHAQEVHGVCDDAGVVASNRRAIDPCGTTHHGAVHADCDWMTGVFGPKMLDYGVGPGLDGGYIVRMP